MGRSVLVTGGNRGIGLAIARAFAAQGDDVAVTYRGKPAPEDLFGVRCDVTDTDQVDALAARVRADLGACHALINGAGVPGGAFRGRDDLDDTLHTLDVNLAGPIRCMAAFAELLAESAPSRVVNIASVAGKLGIGPAGYAASKFGLVGFSEAMALAWRSRGVTVCQLNPGFIHTEGFPKDRMRSSPMARLVREPEDVARAVHQVLVSGATERTVPAFYRAAVVLRHVATPVYRAAAMRTKRSGGGRD